MAAAAAKPATIRKIVRKAKGEHAHSSAWKVAYADFVTAMMAFFLMLWLIGVAGEETLEGIAEYFSDARLNIMPAAGGLASGDDPGTSGTLLIQGAPMALVATDPGRPTVTEGGPTEEGAAGTPDAIDGWGGALADPLADEAGLSPEERAAREAARFAQVEAAIARAVAEIPGLGLLKENLAIDQTPEGLRVQIVDRDRVAMFPLGSAVMHSHTRMLLSVVAAAIAPTPNRLSIRGHTDSLPFAPGAAYDNWRLSSDRALATRVALLDGGVRPERVAEVVGRADAEPLEPARPLDPINRRISIVLQRVATAPAG
jgi:chemotaxis protein MotB